LKILIVDDEEKIRNVIKEYAQFEGYEVEEAKDGMDAVNICKEKDFDIIIMDIMMPKLDVLMLSARGEEYDKLFGFEIGIDDYVVKPFSPKEVMARINAILNRINNSKNADVNSKEKYVFEGLEVDMLARNVFVNGIKKELTPKEYELLQYLILNKNIALSRENILNKVWGYDFYGEDRTVDTHVKMLRNSLENYRDMSEEIITDVDLAVATYLTYTLSYSGIGKGYVRGKFKSDDFYRKRILGLYDCADRLNGLKVTNLNAMLFFRGQEMKNNSIFQWLNDPNVMMFLDPSYFSPDKGKNGKYKNLGKIYAKSFEEEEHEKFLQGIQKAKCKILVCNYDVELYNKYLTAEKGWNKELYPTKTTVYHHSKTQKSNERLEAIWYNY